MNSTDNSETRDHSAFSIQHSTLSLTAAVITVSDKGSRGERVDTSGPALCGMLEQDGWDVIHTAIVPDEREEIMGQLIACADELGANLILTTGGTGFSMRDITPEATMAVIDRAVPGIPEAMRAASMQVTPLGMLSRAAAGLRNESLIINLPGSPKGAIENLAAVWAAIPHGIAKIKGDSADCAGIGRCQ